MIPPTFLSFGLKCAIKLMEEGERVGKIVLQKVKHIIKETEIDSILIDQDDVQNFGFGFDFEKMVFLAVKYNGVFDGIVVAE